MNGERVAAWYAAMANCIPLWKNGSERLANTRSSHSISYWLVTRLLSTGVITAAYSIHSCYLSCLVIGEYIALHHIVSIAARHAVVLRISLPCHLLINTYSYARFSLYCVYTRLAYDLHVLLKCQTEHKPAVFRHLVFERIVLTAKTWYVRMRLSP